MSIEQQYFDAHDQFIDWFYSQEIQADFEVAKGKLGCSANNMDELLSFWLNPKREGKNTCV